VIDNEAPVLSDPTEIIIMQTPGECSAQVSYTAPAIDDNCSGSTLVQTDGTGLSSGDIFPVGTTTLCYQATDASGNTTDYWFDIEVFDTQSPVVVSCPSDVTLVSDPGICGVAYTVQEPIVTDNCGSTTLTNDAPAIFPVGMTAVTWTISDDAGNTVLCTIDVNVFDEELPEITCPDDVTFVSAYNECKTYVTVGPPVTSDNCGVFSIWNSFNNTADASGVYPLGTTQVTWHVADIYGNESSCVMTVTVETPGAPQIICPDDITSSNDPGACGADIIVPSVFLENPCSIVSVTNDFTGTSDASAFYPVGETMVTWTVTDITGYSSVCQTTITVSDDEAPSITCTEDISTSNDPGICGAYVTYPLPFVSDNCDVNVPILLEGPSPGALFNVGTTIVSYMVSDVNGNTAQCNFQVTVTDDETPVITCPEDINQVDSMVVYDFPLYSDNCTAEMFLIEGPDSGSDFDHGYTQIVFAAVDLYGNMDTCSFQVLVNTPPVAVNDTIIVFESNDILEIDILDNDYDLDGDEIHVSDILYGNSLVQLDDSMIYYNIPDNFCGLDSVIYVLMDEYGATDTATVYVFVDCYPTVFVPEGFSPNGDGVNDVLYILGIRQFPNNELKIFNRWGHQIYQAKGYENDWDGRSDAAMTLGKGDVPRGTYFYVLDLGDPKIELMKGFIYINPK
jgi:gliding motility-associated-like protein